MNFKEIVEKGEYYFPASTHYSNEKSSVVCDRCYKENISECVGYKEYDLCMACVDQVKNGSSGPKTNDDLMTYMEQDMFNEPRSLMQQGMFGKKPLTRMEQNMYKK